ncbi:MAG: ABC transporter permease [Beijerinckiaceae bacterium]|jgi:putative hydroxymethylpyrimidine transport system permease protein|nr:ABC transporter permease [Beijerinckiaceae bacterium]MDO9441240.1 ABC transporter permease [Beijerinckiaceae bacterium]
MRRILTGVATLLAFVGVWELAARVTGVPAFVLPPPSRIATTLVLRFDVIWPEALVTLGEIAGGFFAGTLAGLIAALLMARWRFAEEAFGPLLVVAQALPVFAIAPVLVLWFGFGYASKIVMAGLIIFFPVATSFFEGLRRTDPGLIDLARLNRATPFDTLRLIRVPAALPSLAAGLRIAAAVAPLGAVVGEWVGSSAGLGLLMLHANARMQTDLVFAALFVLVALSLTLWALVGALTTLMLRWWPETA